MTEKKKSTNVPYIQQIGPITSKQFGKVQEVLNNYNENVRMEVLYNMLCLMIEQDKQLESDNEVSKMSE